jgi:beta-galactosidase
MQLPGGVKAVWDLAKAYHETTPTRERICINGLWRWQPASADAAAVPAGRWGFLKVPGPWSQAGPRGDQMLWANPAWRGLNPQQVDAAWYEREIQIPAGWRGRRIAVQAEYVNSQATVYVDGQRLGDIYFPGGELDISAACRPEATQRLALRVEAKPLRAVVLSYAQTNEEVSVRGRVSRKGLCGDVFLASTPAGARISDVKIDPSVRKWEITFRTALDGIADGTRYALRADVTDGGRPVASFTSPAFGAGDLREGRFIFTAPWHPEKLWDLNTPGNMYDVQLSLLDAAGQLLDADVPIHFGFREFWVDGRDFYLNGTRVFCPVTPFENANSSVHLATYEAARESLRRLRGMGVNTVFTHYYNCQPGAHLSLSEVLRAADDEGMLVALSQPHPRDYEWNAPDANESNGYARHAAFYVRVAQNHPSVVMYAVSHNSTRSGSTAPSS